MCGFQLPESMDELVYWTNRVIGEGKATCWVYRQDCPSCGKAKMGKPRDPKTGKAKIRAKEYSCPACSHTVEKKEYEETLEAHVIIDCPHCSEHSELTTPFKRKKVQGVDTLRVLCPKCNGKVDITKKMKVPKKKKKKGEVDP